MWDATCHLCDHVLPDTAMRQWVLTAPYEVRRVMALRPDALTACHRLPAEAIERALEEVRGAKCAANELAPSRKAM